MAVPVRGEVSHVSQQPLHHLYVAALEAGEQGGRATLVHSLGGRRGITGDYWEVLENTED